MINDKISQETMDASHHKEVLGGGDLIVAVGADQIHLGRATIWAATVSGSGAPTDHWLRGGLRSGLRGGLRSGLRNRIRNWYRNGLGLGLGIGIGLNHH